MPGTRSSGTGISASEYVPSDRDVELIDWPSTDKKVGLMLLRCDELQSAHLAARKWFRRKGQDIDLFSSDELEMEEMTQQVYLMLIDPDALIASARIFANPDECRKLLEPHQRAYFCDKHRKLIQAKVDSWNAKPDEDEIE